MQMLRYERESAEPEPENRWNGCAGLYVAWANNNTTARSFGCIIRAMVLFKIGFCRTANSVVKTPIPIPSLPSYV